MARRRERETTWAWVIVQVGDDALASAYRNVAGELDKLVVTAAITGSAAVEFVGTRHQLGRLADQISAALARADEAAGS